MRPDEGVNVLRAQEGGFLRLGREAEMAGGVIGNFACTFFGKSKCCGS